MSSEVEATLGRPCVSKAGCLRLFGEDFVCFLRQHLAVLNSVCKPDWLRALRTPSASPVLKSKALRHFPGRLAADPGTAPLCSSPGAEAMSICSCAQNQFYFKVHLKFSSKLIKRKLRDLRVKS